MRLIDAEALYKDMQKKLELKPSARGTMYEFMQFVALDCVETAPTIEAKPVVHAHWKEWYPPKEFILTGEEKLYICSNCDAKYSDIENQRFCPWCGAQMDEVTK